MDKHDFCSPIAESGIYVLLVCGKEKACGVSVSCLSLAFWLSHCSASRITNAVSPRRAIKPFASYHTSKVPYITGVRIIYPPQALRCIIFCDGDSMWRSLMAQNLTSVNAFSPWQGTLPAPCVVGENNALPLDSNMSWPLSSLRNWLWSLQNYLKICYEQIF